MKEPKYKYSLEAICSEPDNAGNRYWAFIFTDFKTGYVVRMTHTGGESNIYAILRYWSTPGEWDRSILWRITSMKKREFKQLTEKWPYGGCLPEEMAAKIRADLKRQAKEARAKARAERTATA